ncbi:hypothetical protein F4801DRAFT_526634 [Xylaria longipes]|nr:hypothetical protein F4801DRAFT_526634 [Xylaria longipes]RYC61861.1 hypothetical protein CHU98_g4359 [Xylaria longipes]
MKRRAAPCEINILRNKPVKRLEQQGQPLRAPICRSRRPLRLEFDGEQLTDAFNFSLDWPMRGVVCTSYRENSEENRSVNSPQFPPSSLVSEQSVGMTPSSHAADFCSHRSNDSALDIDPVGPREIKLLSRDGHVPNNQEKRKIERVTYLPPEIMAMIMSRTLIAPPKCAINLVVPDWRICERETPNIEKLLGITRIVTYVRGVGFQVGTLSHQFGHGDKDHILTPVTDFDPNAFALDVKFSSEYTRQFYRSHTHVFTFGISDLPSGMVEAALGSDWESHLPLRSQRLKAILPFDDEPIDIVKRTAGPVPVPIYQYLRHIAVHSPLELMQVTTENLSWAGYVGHESETEALNNALDLDRSAHLWLSWSKMPNLESVFLDLRIYSHDLNTKRKCLSKFHVIDRAREMSRHLQLKMLMLAGLQSYSFHVAYEGATAQDIEEWDLIDGEPNWIRLFRPAIRGGGKIVLVDRLTNKLLN